MSANRRPPGPRRAARPSAESLEARRLLAVIVVNSAGDADGADAGPTLSLRQAIEIANGTLAISALSPAQARQVVGALTTPNLIDFAIPGVGPFTIAPASPLPAITRTVVIDGYSQPGAHPNANGPGLADNAILRITLDGSSDPPGSDGLVIQADASTVQGLAIGGFTSSFDWYQDRGDAIRIEGDHDAIRGDFLGTDATGTRALGNFIGIEVGGTKGPSNPYDVSAGVGEIIGGTAAGAGNLISGNLRDGLSIYGIDCLVEGNFIGVDATGTGALGNQGDGVAISGTSDTIGGTAAGSGNVIAANRGDGVAVFTIFQFNADASPSFYHDPRSGQAGPGCELWPARRKF